MKATDLKRLIYNPIYISQLFAFFIHGAKSINLKGIKTELIYLVLPFIFNEELCAKLARLNKNSKITVLIEDKDYDVFFCQINQKVRDYKKMSKNGLIVMASSFKCSIAEYLDISMEQNYADEDDKSLRLTFKSAYNLGVLLAKENHHTIFRKLKLTEL